MHTISAEELLKVYNGKYKYVTKDIGDCVMLWRDKPHIVEKTYSWNAPNDFVRLGNIAITEFQDREWHECLYKAKPSEEDWVGKLCIFAMWDGGLQIGIGRLGILNNINRAKKYRIAGESNTAWKCCRPVRPDEIKFFNDDTEEV